MHARPAIRECVHLVTRGHFRSRDTDNGHTIRSAVAQKPRAVHKFYGSVFYRTAVTADRSCKLWK